MASNNSQNSFDNTSEQETKRTPLCEKNRVLECVEEDKSMTMNKTDSNLPFLIPTVILIYNP